MHHQGEDWGRTFSIAGFCASSKTTTPESFPRIGSSGCAVFILAMLLVAEDMAKVSGPPGLAHPSTERRPRRNMERLGQRQLAKLTFAVKSSKGS